MRDEYERRFATLYTLYRNASDAIDSPTPVFRRATTEAVRFADDFPDAASAQHLAGICWYHSPDPDPDPVLDRLRRAEYHFRRALALEPGHPFAHVYLAYVLFDEGRPAEALPLLQATDQAFFASEGQRWRNLKTDELALVCRLQLDRATTEEVLSLVEAYESVDSVDAPVPRELAEFAAALARQGRLDPQIGRLVLRLVEGLGYVQALREALDTIRLAASRA